MLSLQSVLLTKTLVTVGGVPSMTMSFAASPSEPVVGNVNTPASPDPSWMLPPLSTSAVVEV